MSHLADLLKNANSKLATSLKEAKIDPARVIAKSHEIEALQPEDRAIKRAKKAAAGKDDDAAKAARAKKPRSGRPVTERVLSAAIHGDKTVSGPAKNRILRAVNAVREQKKLQKVELKAIF
jgi:hypothetical protein